MQNRTIERLEDEVFSLQKKLAMFLSTSGLEELNPALQLWSQIDENAAADLKSQLTTIKAIQCEIEILSTIASNELIKIHLNQLRLLALVGMYFFETKLYRNQQKFLQALKAAEEWEASILAYQASLIEKGLSSMAQEKNQWLAGAYHHQAKTTMNLDIKINPLLALSSKWFVLLACAKKIVKTISKLFAPQQLVSVASLGMYGNSTRQGAKEEYCQPSCCL